MATRVLVVADDPHIHSLLHAVLTDDGYDVRTAANGAQALEVLAAFPAQVILLDIDMPVMDGVAFAQRYREVCPDRDQAPIIVVTAGGDAAARARQLAAAGFAGKPFDLDELSRSVARVVPHRHDDQPPR